MLPLSFVYLFLFLLRIGAKYANIRLTIFANKTERISIYGHSI